MHLSTLKTLYHSYIYLKCIFRHSRHCAIHILCVNYCMLSLIFRHSRHCTIPISIKNVLKILKTIVLYAVFDLSTLMTWNQCNLCVNYCMLSLIFRHSRHELISAIFSTLTTLISFTSILISAIFSTLKTWFLADISIEDQIIQNVSILCRECRHGSFYSTLNLIDFMSLVSRDQRQNSITNNIECIDFMSWVSTASISFDLHCIF